MVKNSKNVSYWVKSLTWIYLIAFKSFKKKTQLNPLTKQGLQGVVTPAIVSRDIGTPKINVVSKQEVPFSHKIKTKV